MSILTKSQFNTLYNSPSSGSFLTNNSKAISANIIRQFAKDIEDSIPFTSELLKFGDASGTIALFSDDTHIGVLRSKYVTSESTIFHIANIFHSEQTVANPQGIQALEGAVVVSHSSGIVSLAIGTIGNFILDSPDTVSLARSMQAGGDTIRAGTITEWDGLFVSFGNNGGATIISAYGVLVDTYPSRVTNKYGICIADPNANSGFGGITSPTALVHTGASTISRASVCIPHGTAPSSPVNGDMWTTTSGAFIRINGVTKTFTLT